MITKSSNIAVVGLGVLGGSYVQGLSEAGYTHLTGIDINEDSLRYAREKGWVERVSTDGKVISDCDLVICCLYPGVFSDWVMDNHEYFRPGSLLSDVTGVKRAVISGINALLDGKAEFISCHPMAGREFKGIHYADAGRFQKANFLIVPQEDNTPEAIEAMQRLAIDLKFRTITCLSPEEHDRMISFLSQLTHIIAVSLMNANDNTHLAKYTGDSFRDLTRIARINEDMWPELFILNKDYLMQDIDDFIGEMQEFRRLIDEEDVDGMKQKMIQSTNRRAYFDKESE